MYIFSVVVSWILIIRTSMHLAVSVLPFIELMQEALKQSLLLVVGVGRSFYMQAANWILRPELSEHFICQDQAVHLHFRT